MANSGITNENNETISNGNYKITQLGNMIEIFISITFHYPPQGKTVILNMDDIGLGDKLPINEFAYSVIPMHVGSFVTGLNGHIYLYKTSKNLSVSIPDYSGTHVSLIGTLIYLFQ